MIEIKNVHKSFGPLKVLNGVNLSIQDGERAVILGRSGCGKSVLLKIILGLLEPDSGTVTVDGADIFKFTKEQLKRYRMTCGMLFQGAALFDSMNVRDNVAFGLMEHTRNSSGQIDQRVREVLAAVGLNDVEMKMPSDLSGGMRKRVGLARALAMNPCRILYDEPTTGLDPVMADAINDLIIDVSEKFRATCVIVTHDMTSAYKVADTIALLYNGVILETGTAEAIKKTKNPVVRQFVTGSAKGPIDILGTGTI